MPALLVLLPQFIAAGKSLFDLYTHLRATGMQKDEWTQPQEDAYQATLAAAVFKPHWTPDAP